MHIPGGLYNLQAFSRACKCNEALVMINGLEIVISNWPVRVKKIRIVKIWQTKKWNFIKKAKKITLVKLLDNFHFFLINCKITNFGKKAIFRQLGQCLVKEGKSQIYSLHKKIYLYEYLVRILQGTNGKYYSWISDGACGAISGAMLLSR